MKKLYRFKDDGRLLGVCAGFGDYFEVDPLFIRLAAVFLGTVSGFIPMIIAYLIAGAVMPIAPYHLTSGPSMKLHRSYRDRKIAGICGGIAERFQMDSTPVRLGVVLFGIFTGVLPMLVTYFVAWLIIPFGPARSEPANEDEILIK